MINSKCKHYFNICFIPLSVIILFAISAINTTQANTIDLAQFEEGAIGHSIEYFQEKEIKLSLTEAQALFTNGVIKSGQSDSISLGIGVAPAWMKFTLVNNSMGQLNYRLAIETPWLDYIDTWLVHEEKVVRHIVGGDGYPFNQRPMPYKFYAFEQSLPPGITEVYIRVETKGPMAIPVRLSRVDKAIIRDITSAYQYGVLYGIMSALALYNLVLFVFIRQKEYGLYSLYLIGFVINSLSYTGQLHTLITPDYGPYFQDWLDISLMITYSIAGLHFARTLLQTSQYAAKLDRFVSKITIVIPTGMFIGFIFNQLFFSMILAFILNTCFVILFVAMGFFALKAKKPFAVIFLLSSVTAAICITISTLAVAGFLVPYNDYTFKAIEVGMAFEAILLAVILARQFRLAKMDKIIAEHYACTDTLTQLNNRRGFQVITQPVWQNIIRERRDVTIALLDIDFFKNINDQYGHQIGDKVLQQVAQCISNASRKGDICARWGGEEFIIFLPETSLTQATKQAERIRQVIEQLEVQIDNTLISVTTSIGLAGSENNKLNGAPLTLDSLESMINHADNALYYAKDSGKNQLHVANHQSSQQS
ncbi:hypothetical protein tinsulaeT_15850 [Thalassotalea insulae]|uniref:diguanylate cyclase n=1 Tax=Thalassotalea insulae TaxID=2056778 RepID=A0ABQ6GU86_9GAMM|nr:diguanylate cyclase [Thalassotalea insulae]GLX78245.1 hypothetical protein tinsulaeT_15850 [Thalassotalea insulae]